MWAARGGWRLLMALACTVNQRRYLRRYKLMPKLRWQVADIGHLYAPQDVHMRWSERLEEEMWLQGDVEKRRNMKVRLPSRSRPEAPCRAVLVCCRLL